MVWNGDDRAVCRAVNGHPEVDDDLLGAAQYPPPRSLEKYRGMRRPLALCYDWEDVRPVRSVHLPFVEPDDRLPCRVGLTLLLFE